MVSTFSTLLRIELIGTGDQSGVWGVTTNRNLGELLEAAIAGRLAYTHPDTGDPVLSTNAGLVDEARNMILDVSGLLTADRNLICPTSAKLYVIRNGTTGGFSVTLKTAAGTGVEVASGATRVVFCDGTNVVDANLALQQSIDNLTLNAILRDGTVVATANLPMGGNRHTGVGDATARNEYATVGQIQDGAVVFVPAAGVGGTANTIALAPSPAITAYAVGQRFGFVIEATNTDVVTASVSGLGAMPIRKENGLGLAPGDFPAGALAEIVYNGTLFLTAGAINVPRLTSPNLFTGSPLTVERSGGVALAVRAPDDNEANLQLDSNRSAAGGALGDIEFRWDGTNVAFIRAIAGDDAVNKDEGDLQFVTRGGGVNHEPLRLHQEGGAAFGPNVVGGGDRGAGTANAQAWYGNNAFLLPNYIAGLELSNAADTAHDVTIASGSAADSTNVEMLPLSAPQTIQIDNAADRVDGSTLDPDTVYYILVGRDGTSQVSGFSKVTTKPAAWDTFRVRGAVVTDASSNIINNRFMTVLSDNRERFVSEQITTVVSATASIATGLTKSPNYMTLAYVCLAADGGYSVGDRILVDQLASSIAIITYVGQNVGSTAVTINTQSVNGLQLPLKNNLNRFSAIEASWAYELVLETL